MKKYLFFCAALLAAAVLTTSCDLVNPDTPVGGEQTSIYDSAPFVDLGLSVEWASSNIGAANATAPGSFFAWGETQTKGSFSWYNYSFLYLQRYTTMTEAQVQDLSEKEIDLTKYLSFDRYRERDMLSVLEAEDDAATKEFGEGYRIPTISEWRELITECLWEWTTVNGVNGYSVSSLKTNKAIFIPAAGYKDYEGGQRFGYEGLYWSSELVEELAPDDDEHHTTAVAINFDSAAVGRESIQEILRYVGASIRPVRQTKK